MYEVFNWESAAVVFLPKRLRTAHVEKLHHATRTPSSYRKPRIIEIKSCDLALLPPQDSNARTGTWVPELLVQRQLLLARGLGTAITSTEPFEVPNASRLCVFSAIAIEFTAGAQTMQKES